MHSVHEILTSAECTALTELANSVLPSRRHNVTVLDDKARRRTIEKALERKPSRPHTATTAFGTAFLKRSGRS